MVSLTPEERSYLTPAELKAHQAEEDKIVFGHDFKRVKGKPVEVGVGAPGRETQNHLNAIRKYEGEEAYQKALLAAKKKAD
jgi:hypothetical protein